MDIVIDTDFADYYDCWFKQRVNTEFPKQQRPEKAVVLIRKSKDLSKQEQFSILKKHGFSVPIHGTVRDILHQYPFQQLVVYTDEYVHSGEGKLKIFSYVAYKDYPRVFACPYINTGTISPQSYRILWIGNKRIVLHYTSNDQWRSNSGKVSITVSNNEDFKVKEKRISFPDGRIVPLYAVDCIQSEQSSTTKFTAIYAVDLNTSPGLKGTPIEELFTGKEIYNLIEEYLEEQHGHATV